jgi:hypothetical protein
MADEVKVYCKDCEFLYESKNPPGGYQPKGYACKHPSNIITIYNWYGAKDETFNKPQDLNEYNDCPTFKQKGKRL